jgi:hypothetical protein
MEEQNAPKKSILLQGMDDVEDQDINIKASAAAAAAPAR